MKPFICVFIMTAATAMAAETITFESLLQEMTDRDEIATFPDPQYNCRQFSSYDRRANNPADKSTWFANGDSSKFIRVEENAGHKEAVLMDTDGPGAIVRFWTTWTEHPENTVRVYLDNNPEPAIAGKLTEFIDGGLLTGPPLAEGVSPLTEYDRRGHNLYLPIPYAKHCKITYQEPIKGALYYQINYRTYEKGTSVKSFSMGDLKTNAANLSRLRHTLAAGSRELNGDNSTFDSNVVKPNRKISVPIKGPAAIREITLALDAEDMEQALRSTVLEIDFDGNRCVWCPVGDFFGTGHQLHSYRSWYTSVLSDGSMSCRWVMPFNKKCRITLHNFGKQDVNIRLGDVRSSAWQWADTSMYFHATWHQLYKVETMSNEGADHGAFDVNYVTVNGQGVYAGDTLTIFNGIGAWWGEGDEKIFVDGETFPSHFGTGTEDYYGYAWSRGAFFESPFHAQPSGSGNGNPGMSVNSRYRLLDGIPFTKSLKFDMGLWHWKKTPINYAPTTFWYALPGATCNVMPDPISAALPVPKSVEEFNPAIVIKGAIEAETLTISSKTGGKTEEQSRHGGIWSKDKQVWWTNSKPGDKLVFEVPVKKAGKYKLTANLTKAVDYAIVKISINGNVLKNAIDLYNDGVIAEKIELGTAELKEGNNQLEIEITGANKKAKKMYMFGLDYLLLDAE